MAKKEKIIIIDSSSLLLLHKADILTRLSEVYNLQCTLAVFDEVVQSQKHDSININDYFKKNAIDIIYVNNEVYSNLLHFGIGERETILLYKQSIKTSNQIDIFICIDDKKAISFCFAKKIPFINALLVPKLLYLQNIISKNTFQNKFNELSKAGWYSKSIIKRAQNFTKMELQNFFQ